MDTHFISMANRYSSKEYAVFDSPLQWQVDFHWEKKKNNFTK